MFQTLPDSNRRMIYQFAMVHVPLILVATDVNSMDSVFISSFLIRRLYPVEHESSEGIEGFSVSLHCEILETQCLLYRLDCCRM